MAAQQGAGDSGSTDEFDAMGLVDGEHACRAANRIGRHGVRIPDFAQAGAGTAGREVLRADAGSNSLPRHFDQAELADGQERGPGPVLAEVLRHSILDLLAVPCESHVDEVADHEAALVSKSKLTDDLVGRFSVGRDRIAFRVPGAAASAGVDVDRDHRFGLVDHQRSAGFQRNFSGMDHLDLPFGAEGVEEWHGVIIEADFRRRSW